MPEENHIEIAKSIIKGAVAAGADSEEFYHVALAGWIEEAGRAHRNAEFYKGLLDQCVEALPEGLRKEAYISDDGSVQDSPLRLKIPGLVRQVAAQTIAMYLNPSQN